MTGDEIRAAFLGFFQSKGHKIIPSSSLIPRGDPTLLLTSAGMVQFKPYFLGEAVPPSPRLASCQKCFRTTDIESVGDSTHLTFFEMLGNFSIGDYFKREAISWAWEFVTQHLSLPPQRLWITIFIDDDESFDIWRETGVPGSRIIRFGEKDNFWGPAGSSGPCGPCSEIHYDFGEEFGCGKASCAPNCGCGRFSEIWNLVFTQYNQDEAGQRTPLPKPNIDTGMGLERTAAAVAGKASVYETGLFAELLDNISEYTGKKYGSDNDADNAMRVVVEHGRALAFLIADGVMPSNEGRGYVLRRLLRRAALFGRRLGLEKPFLNQIVGATVGSMAGVYPELQQRQKFIFQVVELEEAKFRETLSTGLEIIESVMSKAGKKDRQISGEDAFRLYDTYGFPVELTKEIAADHGFSVDLEGFEREMERQRARSRGVHPFEAIPTGTQIDNVVYLELPQPPDVKFVGYKNLASKTSIHDIWIGSKPTDYKSVDGIKEGQEASIILRTTPFYAEMGGQVGDTGWVQSPSGKFQVTNTISIPPYFYIHLGQLIDGSLTVGDEVEAVVDVARRLDIARNHTATHLLQFALRRVLGEHVQQRGSLVAPERFRFDFSYLTAMTKDEIHQVQQIVNDKIRQNLKVYDEEIPYRRAIEEGATALFDEKYGDVVRVLKIGEPVISAELCGGTHVASTGEIGFFHIIGESSIGAGLRRIEAVTGRGAEEFISLRFSDLQGIAECLGAETENVLDKAHVVVAELDRERKRALSLERELAKRETESLLSRVEVVKGVNLLVAKVRMSHIERMREMADFIRDYLQSVIVVLGTVYEDKPAFIAAVTPDLVAKGYDASKIVRQVAQVTGGGGGGKPGLAQAGGKYKDKLDEALGLVKSLI